MNEEGKEKHNSSGIRLYDVLASHRRSLVVAGCEQKLLDEYSELLRFLKYREGMSLSEILKLQNHGPSSDRTKQTTRPPRRTIQEGELMSASLDQLQEFVRDESIGRKDLERIAVRRFSVPSGSMRSFSNRKMLVGKLLSLIRNEQAHQTISRVARGKEQEPSD